MTFKTAKVDDFINTRDKSFCNVLDGLVLMVNKNAYILLRVLKFMQEIIKKSTEETKRRNKEKSTQEMKNFLS